MKVAETHVLTTLYSARAFIDRHAAQLGTVETSGYCKELDVVITTLEENAAGQGAARRGSVGQRARQKALSSALRLNHMSQITAIAAAQHHAIPELDAVRMPATRATPLRLVADATAMAQVAAQHREVFIAAGLSADFVEQLEAAADAVAQIITDRGTTRAQRTGATAALGTAASRGRRVLEVLSAMIQPQLANDPALLAEWKTARHILRPPTQRPINYALLVDPRTPVASTPAVPITTPVQPVDAPVLPVATTAAAPHTAVEPTAQATVPAAVASTSEVSAEVSTQRGSQPGPLGGAIGRVMRAFGGQAGAGVA